MTVINSDLYNRVLGHGKSYGVVISKPDENEPGRFLLLLEMSIPYTTCESVWLS